MQSSQIKLDWEQLVESADERSFAWCTPSVYRYVLDCWPGVVSRTPPTKADLFHTLVAIGGGSLIDRAKLVRKYEYPEVKLIAVPTLWGSGAECSSIAFANVNGVKQIEICELLKPDALVYSPVWLDSLTESLARWGCGDALSHAIEGGLSPLADDSVRSTLGDVLKSMCLLGIAKNIGWYSLSAAACKGQARSSVGLVHGFAHVLEGPLREAFPGEFIGHARLCSLFLSPVIAFNRSNSTKWEDFARCQGIDISMVEKMAESLFDVELYDRIRPFLILHWDTIRKNPCTRTNCTLVRKNSLNFFEAGVFHDALA